MEYNEVKMNPYLPEPESVVSAPLAEVSEKRETLGKLQELRKRNEEMYRELGEKLAAKKESVDEMSGRLGEMERQREASLKELWEKQGELDNLKTIEADKRGKIFFGEIYIKNEEGKKKRLEDEKEAQLKEIETRLRESLNKIDDEHEEALDKIMGVYREKEGELGEQLAEARKQKEAAKSLDEKGREAFQTLLGMKKEDVDGWFGNLDKKIAEIEQRKTETGGTKAEQIDALSAETEKRKAEVTGLTEEEAEKVKALFDPQIEKVANSVNRYREEFTGYQKSLQQCVERSSVLREEIRKIEKRMEKQGLSEEKQKEEIAKTMEEIDKTEDDLKGELQKIEESKELGKGFAVEIEAAKQALDQASEKMKVQYEEGMANLRLETKAKNRELADLYGTRIDEIRGRIQEERIKALEGFLEKNGDVKGNIDRELGKIRDLVIPAIDGSPESTQILSELANVNEALQKLNEEKDQEEKQEWEEYSEAREQLKEEAGKMFSELTRKYEKYKGKVDEALRTAESGVELAMEAFGDSEQGGAPQEVTAKSQGFMKKVVSRILGLFNNKKQ